MQTQIINIDPEKINTEHIKQCAEVLKRGGLVAFPTETVYGLGALATDANAAKKIYQAKGRPSDNPLIIHIAEPLDAERYAYTCPLYYKLASAFMPGPLTVILPKKDTVPNEVTGGLPTVALRCPAHPIAKAIIKEADTAIAAPSANLSGSPSPTEGQHVIDDLNGRIDAIISGGSAEIGLESTIVKIDGEALTLLRPGAITRDALLCVCETVNIASAVTEALKENERPLSPGMKYRHYAPNAPLVLLDGDSQDIQAFILNQAKKEKILMLAYTEEIQCLNGVNSIDIGKRDDLETQAKRLFSALRRANELELDKIYAHLPTQSGLGLALYNRMIRAAAHTVMKV
ncbi:MAG: threonylcarbamoyl-AMP synthase [Ruminococcaceae bacterium]|nr:threonylcarbamoyl-AMP synthase [Oscillospiraceae bacterium]